jgi:hypothetical protein
MEFKDADDFELTDELRAMLEEWLKNQKTKPRPWAWMKRN